HQEVFSLTRWSWQIHTGFHGPRATREYNKTGQSMSSTGLSPSTVGHSHAVRLHPGFITVREAGRPLKPYPTTPPTQPLPGITRTRFRLDPLSLATTHGITCCFLFHRVLRCFTSPGSLHTPYT